MKTGKEEEILQSVAIKADTGSNHIEETIRVQVNCAFKNIEVKDAFRPWTLRLSEVSWRISFISRVARRWTLSKTPWIMGIRFLNECFRSELILVVKHLNGEIDLNRSDFFILPFRPTRDCKRVAVIDKGMYIFCQHHEIMMHDEFYHLHRRPLNHFPRNPRVISAAHTLPHQTVSSF